MPRDSGRYEPLPSITGLPAYVWRRLPRGGKIAVVGLGVAVAVGVVLAIPQIRDAQRSSEVRAERAEATERERRIRRLRALVKPRRLTASGTRAQIVARLRESIAEDARRRTRGRVLRATCEPPSAAAPAPSAPGTRLTCLAVTSDFAKSASTVGGSIGYPYRAVAEFASGRLTYCRVFGAPGEGGLTSRRLVTIPKACGG